ncbi:MAG TPA: hypothetical protein VHB78_05730 [Vicinamibacterales bacterium]|jgi:hypothetical protein|nr:hypothetical protein [Vicinamibacterales bacterium]
MNPKVLVALVGAGCIAAAGVGAYLGVRQLAGEPAAAVAQPAPVHTDSSSSSPVPAAAATPAKIGEPASGLDAPQTRPTEASPAVKPETKRASGAASSTAKASAPTTGTTATDTPSVQPAADSAPELPVADAPVDDVIAAPPIPLAPTYDERTVPAASVIGIRLDTSISSETARVEDHVTARVTRDVTIDGQTVIPSGAELTGTVTLVDRGGKMRDRARIGVRFDTLVLASRERLPIQTETIFRDGESPSNEASSKIGASAVIGTILGAVIGGKKGAAIGAAAGAGGGTAAVMAGDRNEAAIPAGTPLTVRLTAPVAILVPHEQ